VKEPDVRGQNLRDLPPKVKDKIPLHPKLPKRAENIPRHLVDLLCECHGAFLRFSLSISAAMSAPALTRLRIGSSLNFHIGVAYSRRHKLAGAVLIVMRWRPSLNLNGTDLLDSPSTTYDDFREISSKLQLGT